MWPRSVDLLRALTVAACLLVAACGGMPAQSPATAQSAVPPAVAGAALPPELASAHERATAAMARGDWLEAELELETLALVHPGYAGLDVNLAIAHRHNGRDGEAEAALLRALAVDPAHAAAYNELGILRRRQGRFAEAEAAYRAALEIAQDYALAHYNLGVLLDLYLHRPAEALEHYESYQRLLPEPDERVARWIVDLRRRQGPNQAGARTVSGGTT